MSLAWARHSTAWKNFTSGWRKSPVAPFGAYRSDCGEQVPSAHLFEDGAPKRQANRTSRDAWSGVEHLFSAARFEARYTTAMRPVEPCEVIVAERRASRIRPPEGGRRTAVSGSLPSGRGTLRWIAVQIRGPGGPTAGALENQRVTMAARGP